jgi:hypothetical protein
VCHRAWFKTYYEADRSSQIRRSKLSAKRARARLSAILDNMKACPCADCGLSFPPYVMDFDHPEGSNKAGNIADMKRLNKCSAQVVIDEASKCDVVCANCHRIRTFDRKRKSVGPNQGPS